MLEDAPAVYALNLTVRIGVVADYSELDFREEDLATGSWRIVIPYSAPDSVAQAWLEADWPGIEIVGPGNEWRFAGFVTYRTRVFEAGQSSVVLGGFDFQGLLDDRVTLPAINSFDSLGQSVTQAGFNLGADAHNLVENNAGPTSPIAGRATALLRTGGPTAFTGGTLKSFLIEPDTILERLRRLFTGEPYTARLRLARDKTGVSPLPDFIEFETPERPTSQLRLGIETGGVERIEITERAARTSRALHVGEWVDANNEVLGRRVATPLSLEAFDNWRDRYRERVVDEFNLAQTELDDSAQATLAEDAAITSVQVEGVNLEGWGIDLDIGWLVEVEIPFDVNRSIVTVPVLSYQAQWRADFGFKRRISVGEPRDQEGAALIMHHLTNQARRIDKIESRGLRG